MDWAEFATAVMDGELDGSIDRAIDVLRERQKYVAKRTVAALSPGDRVKIDRIRPTYLKGLTGEVVSYDGGSRIAVRLDEEHRPMTRRFHKGDGVMRLPVGSVVTL